MACLGVHFAIDDKMATRLRQAKNDDELVTLVQEEIEEQSSEGERFETDKAWDALHRCLSDGSLNATAGEKPLSQCFFGGNVLNTSADYFIVLTTPSEVKTLAAALKKIDKAWLQQRYLTLKLTDYQGTKSSEDFEYCWAQFEDLPAFFETAAAKNQSVIFTVDQ